MKSLFIAGLASIAAILSLRAADAPVKPYPLDKCIVSDEKLGAMGKPVSFVYQGQEIKLCCADCRKDFDADPAKYLAKLPKKSDDAKPIAPAKTKGMAMEGCACCVPAADSKSEGHQHGDAKSADAKPGMDCCKMGAGSEGHQHGADVSKPAASAAPAHDHGQSVNAAVATEPAKGAAPKPYPLKTCIVSDNDLDSMGEQAEFVHEGQVIKVCCKSCIAKFQKNPAKYLKKLEGK